MNSPFEEYEDTEPVKKERRYYWLKLKEGFFEDRYIKILKVQPNGYRVLAIYLMLQLKALKSDGILEYSRILPSHTAELAIEIGERVTSLAPQNNNPLDLCFHCYAEYSQHKSTTFAPQKIR